MSTTETTRRLKAAQWKIAEGARLLREVKEAGELEDDLESALDDAESAALSLRDFVEENGL